MNKKWSIWTFVGVTCVLLFISAGCVSTKEGMSAPGTQTPAVTGTQIPIATPIPTPAAMPEVTAAGTPVPRGEALDRDAAFNALLAGSADEIANKTDLVIFEMSQSETLLKGGYSSARLFLAADDLGYTTESYYDLMLETKASSKENENKRIEYIQFLYLAKNAANSIADAAEAESFGDYQTALVMAMAAKANLAGMEKGADLPIASRFNRLNVYLSTYIGRMQENIVQQKTLGTVVRYRISETSSGDRFPRLPR